MYTLLQINTVVNWGSTGHIAEDIGQLLLLNGWESYIAYGRGIPESASKLIRIGNKQDCFFHALQTRLFDNQGLASKAVTNQFIKQIEKVQPDIIHLHNIHGYYLNYKLLFKTLSELEVPVVWTLHDCWAFTGHCAHFSFIGCDKWKNGCFKCPQLKNYPASYLLDGSRRNYERKKNSFTSLKNLTLVSVSDWLAGETRKSFLGRYPIRRIYNGIDTNIFRPYGNRREILSRYGVAGNFLLLGVANVWDQRKGLNDFLRLYEKLPKDFTLLLVGLTKKQIQALPQGIIGIERTESIELLAQLYSAADLFINLSVEETFGLTTAEGLACGTPAIVYRSTACPELVPPEVGFVVEVGDINGIMQKIEIIKNTGKSFYSPSCRKWVLDNFKKEDCYAAYMHLYEELLC